MFELSAVIEPGDAHYYYLVKLLGESTSGGNKEYKLRENNPRRTRGKAFSTRIEQEKASWVSLISLLTSSEFGLSGLSGQQSSMFTLAPSKLAANFVPDVK